MVHPVVSELMVIVIGNMCSPQLGKVSTGGETNKTSYQF